MDTEALYAYKSTELTLKCLELLDQDELNPLALTSAWHKEINDLQESLLPRPKNPEMTELDCLIIYTHMQMEKQNRLPMERPKYKTKMIPKSSTDNGNRPSSTIYPKTMIPKGQTIREKQRIASEELTVTNQAAIKETSKITSSHTSMDCDYRAEIYMNALICGSSKESVDEYLESEVILRIHKAENRNKKRRPRWSFGKGKKSLCKLIISQLVLLCLIACNL
ncbi:hypothetical protein ACOME3_004382 [Neoechinorhynchus agilis]